MNDFPRMLYKAGGSEEIHGGKFSTRIVNDEDEQEQARADGWHVTTSEAKEAHESAKDPDQSPKQQAAADNAAPTRAELEQKATELGITFPPNIGDKKLTEKIAEAIKAKG